MKKFFSLMIGALMLIGLNSCNKDLKVTEANIIGKWAMTAMIVDGNENPANDQVWEFAEDHKMYVSNSSETVAAGTWSLEDKTLHVDFIRWALTVSKLTSKEMELRAYDPDDNILMFSYTFEKVK